MKYIDTNSTSAFSVHIVAGALCQRCNAVLPAGRHVHILFQISVIHRRGPRIVILRLSMKGPLIIYPWEWPPAEFNCTSSLAFSGCQVSIILLPICHLNNRNYSVLSLWEGGPESESGNDGLSTSRLLFIIFCLTHYGLMMPYVSTLAQVMACCLTAPSHHLKQCRLTINGVLWHSSPGNVHLNTQDIPKLCLKFTHLKSRSSLPVNKCRFNLFVVWN